MNYDAIIIGSGLSGLAAGIRLAMFEKKVLIVEKHVEVGGLNSFYTRKHRTFDVGLHAMTNYTPKGVRTSPLGKLLKQLRFKHDEFRLCPQEMSEIRFPDKALRFTNEFEFMEQEIAEQFPSQMDGFQKLLTHIREFNELDLDDSQQVSSREVLESCLTDPVLIDMLYCPIMYYGNAAEGDMDFYQFVIMFKSLFMEGFAKPVGGMPYILKLLVDKYQSLGGELRMGAGVQSIAHKDGELQSIQLENGETLVADKVLSSAGIVETLRLCHPQIVENPTWKSVKCRLSSRYSCSTKCRKRWDMIKASCFTAPSPALSTVFPRVNRCHQRVLCCPNNFQYPEAPSEGVIRLTNQANFRLWDEMTRSDYRAAKKGVPGPGGECVVDLFPRFQRSYYIY